MAAVGPITAGPLRAAGFDPLIPDRGRLGSLVRAVVTYFGGGQAPGIETVAGRLELRSAGIVLDGRHIPLSRVGLDILAALVDAERRHRLARRAAERAPPLGLEHPRRRGRGGAPPRERSASPT